MSLAVILIIIGLVLFAFENKKKEEKQDRFNNRVCDQFDYYEDFFNNLGKKDKNK